MRTIGNTLLDKLNTREREICLYLLKASFYVRRTDYFMQKFIVGVFFAL